MSIIRFEWVLSEGETTGARKDLEDAGVDVQDPDVWEPDEEELDDASDAAFEPMMILAASLSAGALIKVISDVVLKHRYPGGELFDLRRGKLKRRPVPSLASGTLVLVFDDRIKRFEPSQREDGLTELSEAIAALGSAGG
jgi:hypothetical protein